MSRAEELYQRGLVPRLENHLPGCFVLENNPDKIQGIPDLLVLHPFGWGMLEVKESASAGKQPNQEYYVNYFNNMFFGAFIYPENEEEVINALQSAFGIA